MAGGSFLTLADALRLASHPMFSGTARDFDARPRCRIADLKAEVRGMRLELSGRVIATPGPYAIIAYNDPEGGSDYDATTWTAPLDEKDRFRPSISQFKPGKAEFAAGSLPPQRRWLTKRHIPSRRTKPACRRGRFEASNSLRPREISLRRSAS